MKILVSSDIDPTEVIGGAERTLNAEVLELARLGYQITVLVRSESGSRPPREIWNGIKMVRFQVPSGKGLLSFAVTLREAKKAAASELNLDKYDVVFLQQPLSGLGVQLSRDRSDIPIIYQYHSPWSEEYRIRRIRDRKPLANPDQIRSTASETLQIALRRWIEGKVIYRADRVLFLSEYMASQAFHLHPRLEKSKTAIIPGGVDTEHFRPVERRELQRQKLGVAPDEALLLTVRNLEPRMGLGNLLEAMPHILRSEPKAICMIGGSGPLEVALRQKATELGLGDRVRFTGFIPEADLPGYYSAADLFVLPTSALEGFGLVTVEALACGTPVVGTPIGGTPEILRGLDPKLILAGANPSDIADGVLENLTRIRKDPSGWRERCRRYAVENYSWPAVVAQLEEVFQEVVSGTATITRHSDAPLRR